ncbi:hypothetical protein BC830DRAFT_754036 [Chytriomyces sp. MP71]|nr:hypothetical protein BC830DRAFT_754036 [Chytriomyces sp. MP71]
MMFNLGNPNCWNAWTYLNGSAQMCRMCSMQGIVVPTVLALIDDYDPTFKCRGIRLFRHFVLIKLSPASLRATGLDNVFFETLRICLTYHSSPDVLRETFPTILALVTTLESKNSESCMLKLCIIMQEGVIRGLQLAIGGKLDVIRVMT